MAKASTPPAHISRDDLEGKLRAFQGDVQNKVHDKKQTLMIAGGVAMTVLLLLFFFLGKRSGKKKTTFVEIRRI